ncbi:T-complex protein 1 subunit delta [Malassezia caprae]|uniref:T-complex protein 1 subunit delta n=1 Tax=Malassezia caprae TaxID=1381934 RepID=A0AAF0EDE8_9BASI|nr:T-complex protein 1 subunit delta [Malassezia caprae]
MSAPVATAQPSTNYRAFKNADKPEEVRRSNLSAAKAVSDAVRTSLGPKGMDKMIQTSSGEVVITNDGATILKHMAVVHPAARMLVDLSQAQDVEAGDGTTSVVVIAGSLLGAAEKLLSKGIHPTVIAESFQRAAAKAVEFLSEISTPVDLSDRESLLRAATTSLSSKVVSQYSSVLAPIAVDSVLRLVDPANSESETVDLRDIRIVKKVGGTIDDTELVDGLVLEQNVVTSSGGPSRVEKAKIAVCQFQLSSPKPDMDNQIVVNDYRQMDKILKEERQYLLNMCKKIKKTGCNVLLLQKSILRDAVNELALHFLAKLKIMVVKDIERDEIEFLCKSLGTSPIADIEAFTEDKLASAELVDEVQQSGARVVKVSKIKNPGKTVSVLCTGSNSLVLEESERSLHDALCVVRCLVKKRALIAGGGAPEVHMSRKLAHCAQTLPTMEAYSFQAFAEALEVIPTTLAENAGLNPITIVTELRNRHAMGEKTAGINVRKGLITNILEENVLQPLLVSTSALELASETVSLLLRIDDYHLSLTLLEPPTQMTAQSSANAYTDTDTWETRFSASDNDKFVDDAAPDDTTMFADAHAPNSLERAYLGLNGYRGIWLPADRRAFQNQSLFMKIFRIIVCLLITGIVLTLCILMLLFVFLRPPNIGMKNVNLPTDKDVQIQGGSFKFYANLSFLIANPNYVSATLQKVHAVAYDANEPSVSVGFCNADDKVIAKRDNTTLSLPCELHYDVSKDTKLQVIQDIATRCFKTKEKLQFLLKVHISFHLYSFSVPIDVSPTISISCPVTQQQVERVIGKKLDDLGIGSNSRRTLAELLHGAANVAPGDRVLDVGHGCGDSLLLLSQRPLTCLHGVTSLPAHAQRAQKRLGDKAQVWCADAVDWLAQEHADSYDVILALDCAYHFRDRSLFFQRARKHLKPGGRLALVDLLRDISHDVFPGFSTFLQGLGIDDQVWRGGGYTQWAALRAFGRVVQTWAQGGDAGMIRCVLVVAHA